LAVVKIVRDSGYADRVRDYDVILDGNKVGKIGNGETIEFPVSNGRHDLSLKIDWCGSKVIRFTAAEKDVFTFDAESNLRGPALVGALWRAIFARNSWISLKPRGVSTAGQFSA
jgi:hypothetical protein